MPCRAQSSAPPARSTAAGLNGARFHSPQSTIRQYRDAVLHRRWRDEFECYTDQLKSRFTCDVVLCTREMQDAADLSTQVKRTFEKFRVPEDLLERFPSLRLTRRPDQSEAEFDQAIQDQLRQRAHRLECWEREVYPQDIDWAGLIDALKPLYRENYRRHQGHDDHPSQNGLVFHLDYHTYDPAMDLRTTKDRSDGSIVARLRDPRIVVGMRNDLDVEARKAPSPGRRPRMARLEAAPSRGGASRPAERISLVRLPDGWKIAAVPYR